MPNSERRTPGRQSGARYLKKQRPSCISLSIDGDKPHIVVTKLVGVARNTMPRVKIRKHVSDMTGGFDFGKGVAFHEAKILDAGRYDDPDSHFSCVVAPAGTLLLGHRSRRPIVRSLKRQSEGGSQKPDQW
jgi:hypothetical protein